MNCWWYRTEGGGHELLVASETKGNRKKEKKGDLLLLGRGAWCVVEWDSQKGEWRGHTSVREWWYKGMSEHMQRASKMLHLQTWKEVKKEKKKEKTYI
jgi:hypothetical protein